MPNTQNKLRIDKVLPRTQKLAKPILARALLLELDYDLRSKSRFASDLSDGREGQFFLPRGHILADGEVLVAEDGTLIQVVAAKQEVVTIRANHPDHLLRAAYHLGNRHIPVQVDEGFLRIEPDTVLEQMLDQLGVQHHREQAPFEPESGAYGGGHRHGHAETFDSDYALAQKVYAEHSHGTIDTNQTQESASPTSTANPTTQVKPRKEIKIHSHSHPHVHGPGCNHDH